MEMKIPLVAISAFVVVVVLAAVLMPVLGDASETEKTFTNEGYYSLTKLDNTSEAVLAWDTTNPGQVTVNGVAVSLPTTGRLTLLGSDAICVRYNAGSNAQIQVYGSYSGSQDYKALNVNTGGTMTVTISAGVVSVAVNTDAVKNFDLGNDSYLIAPDNVESDYVAVMKITTEQAYLLGDSEIVICGISVSNNQTQSIGVFAKGNMEDGITFSTFFIGSSYSGDVTFTDTTTYSSEVSGYDDLYQLEKYTTTINYNNGSTSAATYSYFIVPHEVVAEKSVHLDSNEIAILAAIPALVIVALLIGVLAIFVRSRMD